MLAHYTATQKVLTALDLMERELSTRLDHLLYLESARQAKERRAVRRWMMCVCGSAGLFAAALWVFLSMR